jgi:hypothetical protein
VLWWYNQNNASPGCCECEWITRNGWPAQASEYGKAQHLVLVIFTFLFCICHEMGWPCIWHLLLGPQYYSPWINFCCWQLTKRKSTFPQIILLVLQSFCDLFASVPLPPQARQYSKQNLFKGRINLQRSAKESGGGGNQPYTVTVSCMYEISNYFGSSFKF